MLLLMAVVSGSRPTAFCGVAVMVVRAVVRWVTPTGRSLIQAAHWATSALTAAGLAKLSQ